MIVCFKALIVYLKAEYIINKKLASRSRQLDPTLALTNLVDSPGSKHFFSMLVFDLLKKKTDSETKQFS